MKKTVALLAALLAALLLVACGSPAPSAASTPQPEDPAVKEALAGLEKDLYPGLTITAAVLERKAILPGEAVRVTVVLKNEGDQTLAYVQGSGSFTTPQALALFAAGLQPVIPKDRLGPATMDFVTKKLAPGESLTLDLMLMTLEPSEAFDTLTHSLHNEEGRYIAEVPFDELAEMEPQLVKAQPGSYTALVTFAYAVEEGGASSIITGGATGYAMASVALTVSG